ncbi:MAG: O-antigen/teichoic acid export membrane protein [Candidatus Azotimanducaceae bacterium]
MVSHLGLFFLINLVSLLLLFSEQYSVLTLYLSVASFGLLINVPRIFHSVLLQRERKWRRIRSLDLLSFVFSSIVAIALALSGLGLWALVVHALLVPVPFVIDGIKRLSEVKPRRFDAAFLPTLRFGLIRSATDAVGASRLLLESGFLSFLVGFVSFGIFGRAIGIAQLLIGSLTQPLVSILHPVLAGESTNAETKRNIVGLLLRVSLWIGVPMTLLVVMFPAALVALAFGEGWVGVVALLPLVGVLVLAQAVRQILAMVLTSQLMTGLVLLQESLILIATVGALWVMRDDLPLYIVSMASVSWLLNACMSIVILKLELIEVKDLFRMMLGVVLGAMVAVSGGWLFGYSLVGAELSSSSQILIAVWVLFSMLVSVRLVDAAALRRLVGYLPGATLLRTVLRY